MDERPHGGSGAHASPQRPRVQFPTSRRKLAFGETPKITLEDKCAPWNIAQQPFKHVVAKRMGDAPRVDVCSALGRSID
jgi:hypothetical protein